MLALGIDAKGVNYLLLGKSLALIYWCVRYWCFRYRSIVLVSART